MRKVLFFISALVIAGVFAGCGKDEEKGNPEALIGTWEYESSVATMNGNIIPSDTESDERITFYADGKVESTEDGIGTYTTKGYSITVTFTDKETGKQIVTGPGQTFEVSAEETGLGYGIIGTIKSQTYSVQGNKLIITVETEVAIQGSVVTIVVKSTYKKVLS